MLLKKLLLGLLLSMLSVSAFAFQVIQPYPNTVNVAVTANYSLTSSTVLDSYQPNILQLGRLGIGTTNAVAGQILLQRDNGSQILRAYSGIGTNSVNFIFTNTGGDLYLGRDNSTGSTVTGTDPYASVLWSTGTYPICFGTNDTRRMRINTQTEIFTSVSTNSTVYFNGLGSAGTGTALVIDANKQIIPLTSSKVFKKNIKDMAIDSSLLYKLRPVEFDYLVNNNHSVGFIAEEVNTILPQLVNYDLQGKPYSLKNESFIPLIVNNQKVHNRLILILALNQIFLSVALFYFIIRRKK